MPLGILPVQQKAEEKPKESQFEKNMRHLGTALQLAQTGMGIAVDFNKFEQTAAQTRAIEAKSLSDTAAAESLGTLRAAQGEQIGAAADLARSKTLDPGQAAAQASAQLGKTDAETAKIRAETDRIIKAVPDTFKNEAAMRASHSGHQVTQGTTAMKNIVDAAKRSSKVEPSRENDLVLLTAMQKGLQPNAKVMQTEYDNVVGGGGTIDNFISDLKHLVGVENKPMSGPQRRQVIQIIDGSWATQRGMQYPIS